MNKQMKIEHIWAEKYRPKTLDEVLLPKSLKAFFETLKEKKEIPHLLLFSGPGTGKTTTIKALVNDLGFDFLYINASLENSIDDVRSKVYNFISTVSLTGSRKVVFLDEVDRLSLDAQNALKVLIEQFSFNASFVFATNYIGKVIEPLQSRFQIISFEDFSEDEEKELKKLQAGRLLKILKLEDPEYFKGKQDIKDLKKSLLYLVNKTFPDFRKAIVELQKIWLQHRDLNPDLINQYVKNYLDDVIKLLKEGKYRTLVKSLLHNVTPEDFYRDFYRLIKKQNIQDLKMMEIITILAKYSHMHYLTVDKELNLAACIAELIGVLSGNN